MQVKIQAPPVLRLPGEVVSGLDALARAGYPHEVCGLLIGRATGSGVEVDRATTARNLAVDRLADRYELDPDDFRRADAAARRDGLDVVGIWHTHPDHPARPSQTDRDAAWPGYSYLIVSVGEAGVAERRAWLLDDDTFVEQEVEAEPS